MAILLKVKWVDQSDHADPYLCIRQIGANSGEFKWKHSHSQAIQFIEEKQFDYYVERGVRAVKLEVGMSPNGSKYLKTEADIDRPELLLSLAEFYRPAPRKT